MDLASYAERLLEEVVKAQGFNVGWNVGAAAGAGVADHLHLHIVPRWNGDHNFMTVLGGTANYPHGSDAPLREIACCDRAHFVFRADMRRELGRSSQILSACVP